MDLKNNMELNKIYQGDCLEVMKGIEDKSVDIVFTSPPYNRKRNDKYKFYNDTIVDYYGFLNEFIQQSIRISRGNVFVNIQKNYYNKQDVFKLIGEFNKEICEIFIWEKSNPMPANGHNITNAYEFIIVFGKEIKSNKTYTKNHITTSVARMLKEHKAIMNQDISDFFITNFSKKGDLVIDPFAGSGTTAISCKNLKRNFILIEKEPEYCKIASERTGAEIIKL